MLCPMSFSPSPLENVARGAGTFSSLSLSNLERFGIFAWNLSHADKTPLETFWYTQFWSETFVFDYCLGFFLLLAVIFANFFLYSINQVIKTKYIILELKVPGPMSTISETYNYAHNILELADVLPNVYFTTNMKRNYLLIKILNTSWLKSFQLTYNL